MTFYRAALIMGAIIFWGVLSSWHDAYGADCGRHPVYCHIVKIAPRTPQAMELSNTFVRVGKRFGLDPHLLVAIAAQESSLRVGLHRVVVVGDVAGCHVRVTDYGLMQIHEGSVAAYGLDRDRLLTDVAYQIEAGALILRDKLKTFGHWSYYHSATPKYNQRYRDAVGRFL